MKVIASIVTYNPNLTRLKQNIDAISPQVMEIVVVDNGSANVEELSSFLKLFKCKIQFIKENSNIGIAAALNDALRYADEQHYDWVFTLDQDSVSNGDVIDKLCMEVTPQTGIICANAVDRNFRRKEDKINAGVKEVDACITSGSLTSVKAWKESGGFDNKMFIDWVDWDICYAMRQKGYKIYRSYDTHILHELGTETKSFHIFSHEYLVLNRSPFRYYYVIRNRIYLARKYSFVSMNKQVYYNIRDIIIALLFEKHKIENLKSMLKGFKDGYRMKIANG